MDVREEDGEGERPRERAPELEHGDDDRAEGGGPFEREEDDEAGDRRGVEEERRRAAQQQRHVVQQRRDAEEEERRCERACHRREEARRVAVGVAHAPLVQVPRRAAPRGEQPPEVLGGRALGDAVQGPLQHRRRGAAGGSILQVVEGRQRRGRLVQVLATAARPLDLQRRRPVVHRVSDEQDRRADELEEQQRRQQQPSSTVDEPRRRDRRAVVVNVGLELGEEEEVDHQSVR